MIKEDFTQGSIVKSLWRLSVPIILANILQTAYQLTDTFWVGRLGAEAVAAVSLSFPVIFLLISLGGGLGIAGSVLVAQYTGAKDWVMVNRVSGQTLLMMLWSAVLISVVGYFISPDLMKLMGASQSVYLAAVSYLRISFLGLIFMFGFFVYQSLTRGVGDVKIPLYIVLGTVLLNLFLDPLFILGYGPIPAYGVSGAALATIGTQGLAAVIGLCLLLKGGYGIRLSWSDLKFDWSLIKNIFRLGLPASLEQSARALAIMVVTFLVAGFGTLTTAVYGIGGRVLSFVIIPAVGIAMATATLIGHNLGAGQVKRAETVAKISSILTFILLLFISLVVYYFARPIAAFFIPEDAAVITGSAFFIKILTISFAFMGSQQVLAGVLRGSGQTFSAMAITLISLWLIRFPLAYVLSKWTTWQAGGIWWSFPISDGLAWVMTWYWFKVGRWQSAKITEQSTIVEKATAEVISEEGVQ